jgi:hypothetical protein
MSLVKPIYVVQSNLCKHIKAHASIKEEIVRPGTIFISVSIRMMEPGLLKLVSPPENN